MPGSDRTLLALLVGAFLTWVVSQAGSYAADRRERRRAVGRALADVLETRRLVLGVMAAVELIADKLEGPTVIPPNARLALQQMLEQQFLPDPKPLVDGYERNIEILAGLDPILAAQIRALPQARPYLARLRSFALSAPPGCETAVSTLAGADAALRRALSESLGDAAGTLAKHLGWRFRRRVRRALDSQSRLDPDAERKLAEILSPFQLALRAQSSQPAQPPATGGPVPAPGQEHGGAAPQQQQPASRGAVP